MPTIRSKKDFLAQRRTIKKSNLLLKPNSDEQALVNTSLASVDVKVCGHCFHEEDNTKNSVIKI